MFKRSWVGLAALGIAGAAFAGAFSVTDAIPNQGQFLVINPVTQSLYVAVARGNSLEGDAFNDIVVYSTADDTVRANIPSASPGAIVQNLVLDSTHNVLYAANADGTLTVIDGATNTIDAVITVGQGPTGIAIDPGLNVAYVANASGTFISVVQGPTRNGAGSITAPAKLLRNIETPMPPAGAIAVDTQSHTVYAVVGLGGTVSYRVAAIDGTTDTLIGYVLTLFNVNPGPWGLAVDESSHFLLIGFVFEEPELWVYDLHTQTVLYSQSYLLNLGFYSPFKVLVDSIHEKAYVQGGNLIAEVSLNEFLQWDVYLPPHGACPAGVALAIDAEAGLAYYTSCDRTGAKLNVWNGASVTPSVVAQIPIGNPDDKWGNASGTFAIVVNPVSHAAYVSNSTFYAPATAPQIAAPAIDVIDGPAAGPSPELSVSVSGSPSVPLQALALPLDYAFGCVAENKATPALFSITNSSAVTAVVLTPIALGSPFTVKGGGTCAATPTVAARGGICEETIDFDPTKTVNYAGGLAWIDSERDTPQVMRLRGGGTGPFLAISPSVLPGGTVGMSYPASGQVAFSVTNAVGTSTVNICATQASGEPNRASCCPSGGGACPGVLPAGMSFTAPNLFAPKGSLTTSGSYPFSVIAVDANNDRGYRDYRLIIEPAP